MTNHYFSLVVFLILVTVASLASAGFDAGVWYNVTMNRPSFTPPGWLYAVIWALVYVFMAVAAWKVWSTEHYSRLSVLSWWISLLVLNFGWAFLFLGWHRTGWSLPLLGLILLIAVLCTRSFRSLSREAAWLMAPYLAWVLFLLVFNLRVWMINGGALGRILG